jgi:hypothetical protein
VKLIWLRLDDCIRVAEVCIDRCSSENYKLQHKYKLLAVLFSLKDAPDFH